MNYSTKPGKYYESASNKEWYDQRNKDLYEDKQKGMSNKELILKYQITPARIRSLLAKERSKHEFKRG